MIFFNHLFLIIEHIPFRNGEKVLNLLFINMNGVECIRLHRIKEGGHKHNDIIVRHSLILNFLLHLILIRELKRLSLIIHI